MPVTEFEGKQERIQALMADHGLEALLLQRVSSFAWATCGRACYVHTASSFGEASLLVTPSGRYVISNNIEGPRLAEEEGLVQQGWELCAGPWYEAQETVARLTQGLSLGADIPYAGALDLSAKLARMRANLSSEEGERFRAVGRLCAEAMDDAIRSVRPGQTEYEIASRLAYEAERRGVQATVNLIATDERIYKFRHPLPTGKEMERYAMLVLCGRRWGLVASITRLVHFGPLPDELRRRAGAVAHVDASFLAATRPGKSLGDIFEQATTAYAAAGFPDEWQLHHQGGPAAYEPREYIATPGSTDMVCVGQAYAWNPSITGAKSEDTVLIDETGYELLTEIEGWPAYEIELDGRVHCRPAILEIL
jgi:Xaa-Pro aminopeptidase